MRGCLGFLVFAAILVTLLAVALVQLVLPAVVTAAVEGSPLVRGQPVQVHVETSLPNVLLHGRIDSIRITGTNLAEPSATLAGVDVTLSSVSITDHTFEAASGSLDGVTIATASGVSIPLDAVRLSGSSSTLIAEITISPAAAEAALRSRLQAARVPADSVTVGPGVVTILIQGRPVQARLGITGSRVVLDPGPPVAPVEILAAPASGEWRIDAVEVTATGIRILVAIVIA